MTKVKLSLSDLNTRTSATEDRISSNEADITGLRRDNEMHNMKICDLFDKIDDLENRHRRSNLKAVDIPEHAKGTVIIKFLQSLLTDLAVGEISYFLNTPMIVLIDVLPATLQETRNQGQILLHLFIYIIVKASAFKMAQNKNKYSMTRKLSNLFPTRFFFA